MPVAFHSDPAAFARAAHGVASRSPCSEALVAIWCANLRRHPPAPGVDVRPGDLLIVAGPTREIEAFAGKT